MKPLMSIGTLLAAAFLFLGAGDGMKASEVKIHLVVDGQVVTATLSDGAAARAFLALLPLDLTLRDYAGTEKVSDLPSRLPTEGAPAGFDPDVGDITYYAPWGNLAIFYRDFGYAKGLVRLGHIDSGVEKLARHRGDFAVRFERADGRAGKPGHDRPN